MIRVIKKYWRIVGRIARMSVMRMLIYKVDALTVCITSVIYFLVQILFIKFLLESGNLQQIAGFDQIDLYLVFAFSQLVIIFVFFFVNENAVEAASRIYEGKLDFDLIKPVNTKFIIMFQRITGTHNLAIFMYLLILFPYIFSMKEYAFDWLDVIKIVYVYLISISVYTIIYWLAAVSNFFWPRFWGVFWFVNNMGDITRWPRWVYPEAMQLGLTIIFPMFLITNPLYNILNHTFTFEYGLQIGLITVVFFLILQLMWLEGLKRYNSAA